MARPAAGPAAPTAPAFTSSAEHGGHLLDHLEVAVKHTRPAIFTALLEPLGLDGAVVIFDALHTVRPNLNWLATEKEAHYIAVVKQNQPLLHPPGSGRCPGGSDQSGQAFAHNEMGFVQQLTGNYTAAAASHREALGQFRALGNREGQAEALNGLGEVLIRTADSEQARDCHQQALAIACDLGMPLYEALVIYQRSASPTPSASRKPFAMAAPRPQCPGCRPRPATQWGGAGMPPPAVTVGASAGSGPRESVPWRRAQIDAVSPPVTRAAAGDGGA